MSLHVVMKKDFRDSMRSYTLYLLIALFTLFAIWLASIQWIPLPYQDSPVEASTLALLNSMRQPTVFFVPLISLAVCYDTIVGERDSGTIRLLLALPHSRAEVVFGKLLGRIGVVSVSILVGYGVIALIALVTYDSFNLTVFALYTLMTLLYAAVYAAFALGFSAAMETKVEAFVGAGILYLLFLFVWDLLLYVIQLIVWGQEVPEGGLPGWMWLIGMLNPSTAFMHAARVPIPEYEELTFYPSPDVFYLQDWVGFVVLALWAVIPLAFGYVRFTRADIE
ncbi:ABC transporter permease subunit [Haloferax namakaokahaiae]|uniref:ABC transporter permease subunit n=1 Tax=Haloferax namakaokahaiae TaxID=1748331 RepID=A0ABD5ZGC5_9EURY